MSRPIPTDHAAQHGDPAHANSAAAKPPRSPQEAIAALLKLEGCESTIDGDGDIRFDHQGIHFLLLFNQADPEYVRVVLPNFFAVGSESERAVAYAAANATNGSCKAVKVFIEHKQTHAAIECFLAEREQIVPVLMRCIGALEHAARSFSMGCALQRGQ